MSTGGGTTTQTVQQNSAPWQPAQPYLQDLFGQAQNTYLNAQGQAGTYPLDVAPFSPTTQAALNLTTQRALNGSPVVGAADSALTNILNGQTAPGTATLQGLEGGYYDPGLALTQAGATAQNGAIPLAAQLASNGPNTGASANILSQIAGQNPAANPATALLGQEASTAGINPYLRSMYDAASQPVIDNVNAQFEQGNRSGSGANQQELTRNLGQLAANIYGTNYNQAIQNQQAAANAIQNAYSTGVGQNLNAAENLGNLGIAGYNAQQGATNLLGNLNQQQAANLLSGGNALSNAYANQAQVQGNAANSLNNAFNTQNQQAVSASAFAVPQLANQDYANLQNLLSVGQTYDQQNQNLLNNNLAAWSYAQQQPWNILNDYSGVLTGLGSLGGTKSGTQTTTQPSQSIFPSLIGSGLGLLGSASSTGNGSILGAMLGL